MRACSLQPACTRWLVHPCACALSRVIFPPLAAWGTLCQPSRASPKVLPLQSPPLPCRLSQLLLLCAPKSPSGPRYDKTGALIFSSQCGGHFRTQRGRRTGQNGSYIIIPAHLPFPDKTEMILAALWPRVGSVHHPNGPGPYVEEAEV